MIIHEDGTPYTKPETRALVVGVVIAAATTYGLLLVMWLLAQAS